MSDDNEIEEESTEEIDLKSQIKTTGFSRRNMLRVAAATGASAVTLSTAAAANPKQNKRRRKKAKLEDPVIYQGEAKPIQERKIRGNISDKQIQKRINELDAQTLKSSSQIEAQDVGERCLSDTIPFDDLPAITLDVCLSGSCDWNIDVGALGQTITLEETECGKLCRTVTADAFFAFSEVTVCFELTSEGYLKETVTQKYCSYSRSDGWTCSTKSKTNTNTDITFDI